MKRLSKPYSTIIATLLFVALLFLGWKREDKLLVISENGFKFLNKYPKTEITNYTNEVSNLTSFKLSPKLQSSIFFSLFYILLCYLILVLYSSDKFLGKILVVTYLFYMVISFVFMTLYNYKVDYRLSAGLAHYLEDFFLSPIILMAFITIYHLKEKLQEKND
jgi:amino acid permease